MMNLAVRSAIGAPNDDARAATHAATVGDDPGAADALSPRASDFLERLSACQTGGPGHDWRSILTGEAETSSLVSLVGGGLEDGQTPPELSIPPGDKGLAWEANGARISVRQGERTRLVIQNDGEAQEVWLHAALAINAASSESPVAAIRAYESGGDEHLVIRFREGAIILAAAVRVQLASPSASRLISIGVVGGDLSIYLDGWPAYRRKAPVTFASAFIMDFIGIVEAAGGVLVHALALQRGGRQPFWSTEKDETILVQRKLSEALDGSPDKLEDALYALAGFPAAPSEEALSRRLFDNREASPFRPSLEGALLDRASPHKTFSLPAEPEPVVRVRNVSVELHPNPAGSHSFHWKPDGLRPTKVVDDVSFDAFAGDIIGILGRNGAGKTTFLKTLVGAMPLSAGRIDINGKAVLLRPGAGMQPNLTGRQNILKCGLHMDLTPAEIARMTPDIVALADLADHIDRPFKYYSDGMRSRLIFAMATAMPYDILLLDELLSAGDIGFQKVATERLNRVIQTAKAVFVVQHAFDFVLTRCTKCLVLEKGKPIFFGSPRIAAEMYRERVTG